MILDDLTKDRNTQLYVLLGVAATAYVTKKYGKKKNWKGAILPGFAFGFLASKILPRILN